MITVVDVLRHDGISGAPGLSLSREQAAAITQHVKDSVCTDHHVFGAGGRTAPAGDVWGDADWPVLGLAPDVAMRAPHYLTWALSGYEIAADYFGEEPLIYSTNVFVTQPSPRQYRDTHGWHRDRENPRMLVMFLYGTDVISPDDGAHLYEAGSHCDPDGGENYNGYQPTRPVRTITGLAGTTFFIDPHGVHMGMRPTTRPRLLIWTRWCAASSTAGAQGPVPRALVGDGYPDDPMLQAALRLIVA